MAAQAAIDAPRVHYEDGVVYTEPGVDADALRAAGYTLAPFRDRNLFFGGAQAVAREADGSFEGGEIRGAAVRPPSSTGRDRTAGDSCGDRGRPSPRWRWPSPAAASTSSRPTCSC